MWFIQSQSGSAHGNNIVRITPKGNITRFPVPHEHYPIQLMSGPNSLLWFHDGNAEKNDWFDLDAGIV